MGRQRFLGTHKKALMIKNKIDKLDFIKFKNLCSSKGIINKMKTENPRQDKITFLEEIKTIIRTDLFSHSSLSHQN